MRMSLKALALSKPRARVTKCPKNPRKIAMIKPRRRGPVLFVSSGLFLSLEVISPMWIALPSLEPRVEEMFPRSPSTRPDK